MGIPCPCVFLLWAAEVKTPSTSLDDAGFVLSDSFPRYPTPNLYNSDSPARGCFVSYMYQKRTCQNNLVAKRDFSAQGMLQGLGTLQTPGLFALTHELISSKECKRRKVKCNGQTPCLHCNRHDVQCEYPVKNTHDDAGRSR